jgi:hypothetical protein
VLVVGLVGQRVRDLLQIDVAQLQHPASISLSRCPHSRTGTRMQRHERASTEVASRKAGPFVWQPAAVCAIVAS